MSTAFGLYFELYSFSVISSNSQIGIALVGDWIDDIIEWSKPCFDVGFGENLLYIVEYYRDNKICSYTKD